MVSSIVWAVVTMYLLWRAEVGFKSWLAHREPLHQSQYKELDKKISEMQNQVNSISIQREIE